MLLFLVSLTSCWCQHQCQCCISIWLPWSKKCSGIIDDAIGITWWWCWCQWHHIMKKVMFISFWSSWLKRWNDSLMALLAGCETVPTITALHDQKSYVALHFDYFDWRNAVVPLMMPLPSYDAEADANGFTWPKISCCISYWSSCPNKWYGGIYDTVGIMQHWNQHDGITWTKSYTLFQSSLPHE